MHTLWSWVVAHKLLVLVGLVIVLFSVGALVHAPNNQLGGEQATANQKEKEATLSPAQAVTFTHPIVDPATIRNITPLGELNGGYEEAQTLTGVMFNFQPAAVAGNKEIEVKAPTDMTLESYSFHKVSYAPGHNWALIFKVTSQVTMRIDHISRASDAIQSVTTTTPLDSSAEERPNKKLSVKAGEVIGYTFGTVPAHNWNFYVYDTRIENTFVNQARYTSSGAPSERAVSGRLVIGACAFDYYAEDLKKTYLALMGYNKAGESATCGQVSHDTAGTASGMWHFTSDAKAGVKEERDGVYTAPLSIIKNSAGEVTVDQVGDKRLSIYPGNQSLKDPAEVRDTHCYQANEGGYAYIKIVSETVMTFAASPTGSCPATFPIAGTKTYYR